MCGSLMQMRTRTLQRDASLLGVEDSLSVAGPVPLWGQTGSLFPKHNNKLSDEESHRGRYDACGGDAGRPEC